MTILAIKSLCAAGVAFAAIAAARTAAASIRHLVLAAFFVFLLLMPLVQHSAPGLAIPVTLTETSSPAQRVLRVAAVQPSAAASATDVSRAPRASAAPVLFYVYLAGVLLLLARLACGIVRLQSLRARGVVWLEGSARMTAIAQEAGIRRAALVLTSADVNVPLTFGARRSTIVLPFAAKSWPEEELTSALRHELEHVRREDWVLQILARVAAAIYWPNPLVWLALKRFFVEAERACDDAVVASGRAAEGYAEQLVALARRSSRAEALPALAMASPSRLALRVCALLDPKQRRGPHGAYAGAAATALTLALLLTVAPARLVAATSEVLDAPARAATVDDALGEALVRASSNGDVELVERLLAAGLDVNMVVEGDGTALIGAVREGRHQMVEYLLARGADVNVPAPGDGSPLIAAAAAGFEELVTLLLDRGANVNTIVPGDENPLMQAARYGHADIVRLLLDRGADVHAIAFERGRERTALRLARAAGHDEVITILRAAGARR